MLACAFRWRRDWDESLNPFFDLIPISFLGGESAREEGKLLKLLAFAERARQDSEESLP
jgi:hypothetical protein